MLRSPGDFAALQEQGRSRSHPLFTVRVRANGLGRNRYAIATGKKLGTAVDRNRVRRRVREILRRLDEPSVPGRDILVAARPASVSASYADLSAALERLMAQPQMKEGTTSQ
jgi:ribonuclease P protein component